MQSNLAFLGGSAFTVSTLATSYSETTAQRSDSPASEGNPTVTLLSPAALLDLSSIEKGCLKLLCTLPSSPCFILWWETEGHVLSLL